MSYIKPEDVDSPRQNWTLITVLDDGKADRAALAIGRWNRRDGRAALPVLAMRWNGDEQSKVGNPQSRGLPTWFIVPEKYNEAILSTLPSDKLTLARSFFPKQD